MLYKLKVNFLNIWKNKITLKIIILIIKKNTLRINKSIMESLFISYLEIIK